MLEQPIAEGARMVRGQRRLHAVDGIDLTTAQPFGIERRHCLQSPSKRRRLFQPSREGFGPMKREGATRDGFGIGMARNRISLAEATYSKRT